MRNNHNTKFYLIHSFIFYGAQQISSVLKSSVFDILVFELM